MYQVFDAGTPAEIYYDSIESGCVCKALEDLRRDLYKVSGQTAAITQALPPKDCSGLIVGTLSNKRFASFLQDNGVDVSAIEAQWESYIIRTIGGSHPSMVIAGSDKRGTMWGIYEFSQRFLGVDPLYLWTDHEPSPKSQLLLEETSIIGGPKAYKFRGWFINDEDLIEGFCKQGAPAKDYRYQNDYAPVLEMIIETALRLKQNLLIPCSHLDLDNPAEEELVRIVTERGMYISMHHQEPVGVHQFTIDRYWKERGADDVNFVDNPDKYREVWSHYIHKWAQYEDVIWQLGLRGRGDRPVWYNNSKIPSTTETRGKIISDAINMQLELVKKEYLNKPILSSATLWMEGMSLYKENALSFPEGTMVVFADFGPDQMLGENYYTAPRMEDTAYGVYYHVGFWGCGPHLVQGNPPEKIYFNYKQASEKGDSCYSILNVSNIREFVFGIQAVAEITWNIDDFEVEKYRKTWCQRQFHLEDAEELAGIYRDYYQCFYEMDHAMLPGQMLFMDGMTRRVALKLMEIIKGGELRQEDIQNKKLYNFSKTDDFITCYKTAAAVGGEKFKALYHRAVAALDVIPLERRQFFINNMIVQIEIMMGLYQWVNCLASAAENRRLGGADDKFSAMIEDAVSALEKLLTDRRKAAQGRWEHWYDGDSLINLPLDIQLTNCLRPAHLHESVEIDIMNSKF